MSIGAYKKILDDSTEGYLGIKGIKHENIYTNIEINYINNALNIILKKENKHITEKYILDIIKESETNLNKALSIAKKKNKYTITTYLKSLNYRINIDFYYLEEDEFFAKFIKLEKESKELSSVLKDSPFAAWIKDLQGRYIEENIKHNEIFARNRDDIIGKTDHHIFDKETADKFTMQDKEVIYSNQLKLFEHQINIGEGRKKYFHTAKWPYKDANNLTIGTIGVTIEITDNIELQKSIEKNDRIFSEIADNIEDVMMIRDAKKAQYISPSFEKVFGFNPSDLYEDINNWYNFFDKVEYLKKPLSYNNKETTEEVMKLIKPNKEDQWIKSKFCPVFDENGNVIKKIGIISDITKSKKLEEEIEALRMDFFANISHELRTPINLILCSLQVLNLKVENLDEENSQYFDKYLKIISQNGLRLLKLANNLIDSTKLDAGSFSHSPQNYDIVNFVENICMSVVDFVKLNNMSIVFDTNEEEKIVAFDLNSMERIMLNLLSNAIKFNNEEGEIQVNVYCDKDIRISVKDSGIGIPIDKVDSIFGRFEQVSSKIKTQQEGSGIGLSLVKSLAEIHGGSIEVNTSLGKGSEFTVILPDKLIDDEIELRNEARSYKNVNTMKVEFSDIYV